MIKSIKSAWFFTYRLTFCVLYFAALGAFVYGVLSLIKLAGI